MKILITGGAGFVGSHMVRKLLDHDHDVTVLDDLSNGYRSAVSGAKFVLGDVGNVSLLNHLFSKGRFDAVMHFAASTGGVESMRHPAKFYDNNLVKSLGLFDAMVRHGASKIVYASSAAVYGDPAYSPLDEGHRKQPSNPFGASKWMTEQALQHYERAYGLKSISLRYFNVAGADPVAMTVGAIGPGTEAGLVPRALQVASGRRPSIELFGRDYETRDGSCIRDFVHVSDVCDAHMLALDKLASGTRCDAFNLGCGIGYSVQEIITTVLRVTGKPIPVRYASRRFGDPAQLVADSRSARQILGWQPRFADIESIVQHAWQLEQKLAGAMVQKSA